MSYAHQRRRRLPPAASPLPRGGWEGARARWETSGGMLPLEKLMAVVAVGQMMRIAVGAVWVWMGLADAVPKNTAGQTNEEEERLETLIRAQGARPVFFFRAAENHGSDTLPVPQEAAHTLLGRLSKPAASA